MKLNRCVLVFTAGVTISLASYAFFQQMMSMPQQMMGSMMVMGNPPQNCDCKCDLPK